MDNGASSYRRFLDGDENGFVEIVRDYKDGLILYLDSLVRNISAAEELAEDTLKLKDKKIEILRQITTRDEHGFTHDNA